MIFAPKDGKGFLKDFQAIAKADGEFVDVGFFSEQGKHPTADMTYPELAELQANGGGGRWTPRDILAATARSLNPSDRKRLEKAIDLWLTDPTIGEERMLEELGEGLAQHMKDTFGSRWLNPTEANPDPLVDSGALMEHTAYKVKDGVVKEI